MMDLDTLRDEIDRIDEEITALFEKRMETVLNIARYKKENGIEILNAGREEQVLEKACARLENSDITEETREFFTQLMRISRQYQKRKIEE